MKRKIRSNKDWQYVVFYADEEITGTVDYKREDFMQMKFIKFKS